ncbi:MAG: M15 family metallopeptidase [Bacillota bacterium]
MSERYPERGLSLADDNRERRIAKRQEARELRRRRRNKLVAIIIIIVAALSVCFVLLPQLNKPDPVAQLEIPKIDSAQYYQQLVSAEAKITDDFKIMPLVYLDESTQLEAETAAALILMMEDLEKAGLEIMIMSGYRTYEKQEQLYQAEIKRLYRENPALSEEEVLQQAATKVAVPGSSEHQLGLAVDIAVEGVKSAELHQSAVGRWIEAHGAKYGFIVRYPQDKQQITGVIYEPWHLRYVRAPLAKILSERDLCLEEYLAEQAEKNV